MPLDMELSGEMPGVVGGLYASRLKRLFDVVLTVIALPLIVPVSLLIYVLIKLDSRGPALVKVNRLGRNHSTFYKYKFRTMQPDAERLLKELLASNAEIRKEYEATYKIKNDPRITRFGRLLRKTSLDELAQVLNVIRGEMSWVGPRDILPKELEKYGEHGEKFVSVRPGITGLWQVSGRSRLSYAERVRLDMYYVDHLSLWLDLKILLKTVPVVLFGDGAV
jgi:lipopolysaccharide/colanic/teichoic acid biosynthesis glycosyltransferase